MLRFRTPNRMLILAVLIFSLLATGTVSTWYAPVQPVIKPVPLCKLKACRRAARCGRSSCQSSTVQNKRKTISMVGPAEEESRAVLFELSEAAHRRLMFSRQVIRNSSFVPASGSFSLVELHVQLNC